MHIKGCNVYQNIHVMSIWVFGTSWTKNIFSIINQWYQASMVAYEKDYNNLDLMY